MKLYTRKCILTLIGATILILMTSAIHQRSYSQENITEPEYIEYEDLIELVLCGKVVEGAISDSNYDQYISVQRLIRKDDDWGKKGKRELKDLHLNLQIDRALDDDYRSLWIFTGLEDSNSHIFTKQFHVGYESDEPIELGKPVKFTFDTSGQLRTSEKKIEMEFTVTRGTDSFYEIEGSLDYSSRFTVIKDKLNIKFKVDSSLDNCPDYVGNYRG